MIAIAMLLLFQAGIADKPAPQTIAPPIWNVHVMPATIPTLFNISKPIENPLQYPPECIGFGGTRNCNMYSIALPDGRTLIVRQDGEIDIAGIVIPAPEPAAPPVQHKTPAEPTTRGDEGPCAGSKGHKTLECITMDEVVIVCDCNNYLPTASDAIEASAPPVQHSSATQGETGWDICYHHADTPEWNEICRKDDLAPVQHKTPPATRSEVEQQIFEHCLTVTRTTANDELCGQNPDAQSFSDESTVGSRICVVFLGQDRTRPCTQKEASTPTSWMAGEINVDDREAPPESKPPIGCDVLTLQGCEYLNLFPKSVHCPKGLAADSEGWCVQEPKRSAASATSYYGFTDKPYNPVYVKNCSNQFVPIYSDSKLTTVLPNPFTSSRDSSFTVFITEDCARVRVTEKDVWVEMRRF